MKKFLLTISFILSTFNVYSMDFDYKWTNNHPALNKYIENNRDKILKIAPISNVRSQEYKNFIQAVTRVIDVPKELMVLPAIESNFNPTARSHAGAQGMWQFMRDTAKDMGLEVNGQVDERNNWKKSTVAGLKYLKWMAEDHFEGNYELAILAYNAGVGKVKRAMKKYDTKDPWELIQYNDFKQESKEFLPKFITYMNYYFYIEKYGVI